MEHVGSSCYTTVTRALCYNTVMWLYPHQTAVTLALCVGANTLMWLYPHQTAVTLALCVGADTLMWLYPQLRHHLSGTVVTEFASKSTGFLIFDSLYSA